MLKTIIFLLILFTISASAHAYNLALPVQLKPYERGNCFQWRGCKGDSIGAMWVDDPITCGRLGGKSWMDEKGQCRNLPLGARSCLGHDVFPAKERY